jgi:uncharacterized protein YegL
MDFTLEAFHNPYLAAGTSRVDAIVTVSAQGQSAVATSGVVGIIVDTSGSMQGQRIEAVRLATRKAISLLNEASYFFVIVFADRAAVACDLMQANSANKMRADASVRSLEAGGGTHMSAGLTLALQQFQKMPNAIRQALFLTDGKNSENDDMALDMVLRQCQGVFQCDCRGVGTDWQVKQLQRISTALLGSAQIIPDPSGIEADFRAAIEGAQSRAVSDVRLRLWTPKSARIVAVQQMSPDIVVLTDRGTHVDPQTTDYPTGAWGQESRDYYVAIEMNSPGGVGDEMLAARPSLIFSEGGQAREVKNPAARVLASWTDDEALSAKINAQVAHYTGQEELASAIQEGLEARERGDVESATRLLGRAAKLAEASNNEETTARLKKVVDIVDAHEGTVRLKSNVKKADEMDLDLGSTRTARARR